MVEDAFMELRAVNPEKTSTTIGLKTTAPSAGR
jgi:hypothetical protein